MKKLNSIRCGRLSFIGGYIMFIIMIVLSLNILSWVIPKHISTIWQTILVVAVIVLLFVGNIILLFYFIVRRLNDIGWNKWYALLFLVPVINIFFIGCLIFIPGKKTIIRLGI